MKKKVLIMIAAALFLTVFESASVYAQTEEVSQEEKEQIAEQAEKTQKEQTIVKTQQEKKIKAQQEEEEKKKASKKASSATVQKMDTGETVKETRTSKAKKSYTNAEWKLLACLVYAEAGNQPYKGKVAVANVVLNRVKSNLFPNTIKEVIYQSAYSRAYGRTVYQFSVASPSVGTLKKALNVYGKRTNINEIQAEKECIKAAKAALEGKNTFTEKYIGFSRYSASLASQYPNGTKLGAHYFFK